MTELKLSEIKNFLPKKEYSILGTHKYENPVQESCNKLIDDLSTKNLLDFVEAVVCDECGGKGLSHRSLTDLCEFCHGTGAVIRVKESKNEV